MIEVVMVKKNRLNALIKMAMHLCVLCPRQKGPKTCQGYDYCHRTLFNYAIDREKDIKENDK